MTIKVIKNYVDKFTKVEMIAGRVLRDVPDKRAQELIDGGYAMDVSEDRSAAKNAEVKA